ncbi:hypothetical protein Rhopal_003513-T1 [Rhodotorula paludigena]|uniref:J domain-containing protein n=1 Tax=Rhodotorula paludigena TaxID=86838 RepID=A0AAV5GNC1_9BASI|nr:hypothetical protein Rhopal_003513-T1 [Rhodotorula paludigena]
MASPTIVTLNVALPPLTKEYKAPSFSAITAPQKGAVYAAGPAFHAHARRLLNQRSFAEDDRLEKERLAANGNGIVEEDDADADLGNEEEDRDLLELDPKRWKEQDHYAVLGLQHLRYKANQEQIKKAHRRKVLRHHPDKKANASHGGSTNDDSFFKCIAKAMETLSNPEKRRGFDSVDPAISDDFPDPKETTAENFFELWAPVLEREGRFSKAQPVPALGGPDAPKNEVESFYDFFYNMDSWRSFEYDDKDAPEGTDSRDEKRHQEKKNKAERDRKKKEDNTRRRTLVDTALALDPRIKAFRAAEKAAREAKRRGGAPAEVVDPKAKEEAERKAKEEADKAAAEQAAKDASDKADREAAKKAKAAAAKEVKKNKKAITNLVTQHNYFTIAGTSPAPATVEACFSELDLLFSVMEPEEVAAFKSELDGKSSQDEVKAVFVATAKKFEGKVGEGKFKEFA